MRCSKALLALVVIVLFSTSLSHAESVTESVPAPAGHLKVIDFEDELVEGMNKQPLDSLSQLSERERARRKSHLYRKRAGFRVETSVSLQQMRYAQ